MVEQIRQGDIPGVQLRYRHSLIAKPREIWPWLTQAERLTVWLAERVDPDASTGGAFLLERTDSSGQTQRERLVTVMTDEPAKWVFDLQNLDGSWPTPTRVTLELTPSADGSELSVLQTGFAHLPLSDCLTIWEAYRRRWRSALSTLAERLASECP